MNQLLTITKENASTLTMSSREIAELCEKRHDNVLKLVRELIERGLLKIRYPIPTFIRRIINVILNFFR